MAHERGGVLGVSHVRGLDFHPSGEVRWRGEVDCRPNVVAHLAHDLVELMAHGLNRREQCLAIKIFKD